MLLALQLLVERPLIRGVYGAELLSAARLRGVAGQALSELLDAARAQRSVALRVAAVRVVERLCAMPLAPDVAGFFLPGVASRLCALCPPDEKARSPVQLAVLKALRALLLGPMLDQLNGAALNADYEALEAVDYRQPAAVSAWLHAVHERARSAAGRPPAAALGAGPGAPESRDAVDAAVAERVALARAERPRPPASAEELAVVRDGEWLRATAARLRPHVRGVYAACGRGSWRVRRALVVFAVSLCVDGARSLAACVPDALDVVCTAVCDAYPQVRRAARFGLRKLAERLGHTAALVAPIGHNFERQLAGLPAAVRTLGDRPKQRALHALAAQLEILGRARALAPLLATRLPAVLAALCAALRFEAAARPLELRAPYRLRGASRGAESAADALRHLRYSRCPLAHLHEPAAEAAMVKLCRTLGAHAPLPALVHQLVFVVRSDGHGATVPRKEALWVLAHALDGAGARAAADAADAETRAQIEAERREAGDEEAAEEEEEGEEGEGEGGGDDEGDDGAFYDSFIGLGEEARGRGLRDEFEAEALPPLTADEEAARDDAVLLLLDALLARAVWHRPPDVPSRALVPRSGAAAAATAAPPR